MSVQRHREPSHAQAEIPGRRGEEKARVLHGALSAARVSERRAFRRTGMRLLVLAVMLGVAPSPAEAALCSVVSGPATAAVVELYTSEGCSSCPPADRWLATLGRRYSGTQVVPLALHVDYWDYIGWKDPYARREFSLRQRKLSQLQRLALVYTPQVLLAGAD